MYFTTAYSKQHLSDLDTLASSKMSMQYGSRDTIKEHLSIIEGVNRVQLAETLNISIDKIRPVSPVIDLSGHAYDSLLPKFKVTLDDGDVLPLAMLKEELGKEEEIAINKMLLTNESSSQTVIDIDTLQQSLQKMLVSFIQKKVLEKQQKLNKLAEAIAKSLKEYESKVNEIAQDFVNNWGKSFSDDEASFVNKANAEIQAIEASIQAHNANIFAQKTAELDAATQARVAAARSTPPSYTLVPTTITITNADIAAMKQAEYHSALEQYKQQCENQITAIKASYEEQAAQRKQSLESEISNTVQTIRQQKEDFSKHMISKCTEMKPKLLMTRTILWMYDR